MVVLEDGTLWGFGSNQAGQLAMGAALGYSLSAVPLRGFDGLCVHQLCCGDHFGVALATVAPGEGTQAALSGTQHRAETIGGDKELVLELYSLHDDVAQTQSAVEQLQEQTRQTQEQQQGLQQEIEEWKAVIAEMNTTAGKARKIEQEEAEFHQADKARTQEQLAPLRELAQAREDELHRKQQALEAKQRELAELKRALAGAAREQAEAESAKRALECDGEALSEAIQREQERADECRKAVKEASSAGGSSRQHREHLRQALFETQQAMLRAHKSDRKALKHKAELLDKELSGLSKGSGGNKDVAQETKEVRAALDAQLEEEISLREELEEQMVRWQDEVTRNQQATVSLADQKKHLKDLEHAAAKGIKEAEEDAQAAEACVAAAHIEVINLGNKELALNNQAPADVSSNEKVMMLVSDLFQNANVSHDRLLDNYEVAALLERLWLRVGKKPLVMQLGTEEARLTGIVQKTMQAHDEGKSMIDFDGFLRMVAEEPWNQIFDQNNVHETLPASVEEYIKQMARIRTR